MNILSINFINITMRFNKFLLHLFQQFKGGSFGSRGLLLPTYSTSHFIDFISEYHLLWSSCDVIFPSQVFPDYADKERSASYLFAIDLVVLNSLCCLVLLLLWILSGAWWLSSVFFLNACIVLDTEAKSMLYYNKDM